MSKTPTPLPKPKPTILRRQCKHTPQGKRDVTMSKNVQSIPFFKKVPKKT